MRRKPPPAEPEPSRARVLFGLAYLAATLLVALLMVNITANDEAIRDVEQQQAQLAARLAAEVDALEESNRNRRIEFQALSERVAALEATVYGADSPASPAAPGQ